MDEILILVMRLKIYLFFIKDLKFYQLFHIILQNKLFKNISLSKYYQYIDFFKINRQFLYLIFMETEEYIKYSNIIIIKEVNPAASF